MRQNDPDLVAQEHLIDDKFHNSITIHTMVLLDLKHDIPLDIPHIHLMDIKRYRNSLFL